MFTNIYKWGPNIFENERNLSIIKRKRMKNVFFRISNSYLLPRIYVNESPKTTKSM